jgi:ankyrin repeat protein
LKGNLGALFIELTGNPFYHTACDSSCDFPSTPALSITAYYPWQSKGAAFNLTFRNGPSPAINLSFPRIVRPDSDLFVGIREGDCESIKALLMSGQASLSDTVAPYGLSPLLAAILYRQVEAYKFLIVAGAGCIIHPTHTATGMEVWSFWEVFSSQDYSMAATDIARDNLHLCAAEPHAHYLSNTSLIPSFESSSFTRLHRCVLRLTQEPLEKVLESEGPEIDIKDCLGRTALHLATYISDAESIRRLLLHGANPDIREDIGKTPIHIAGALGSITCTRVLIAGGADLDATDHFGQTALHHACMQGHAHILSIFLDSGANMEATNHVGETPLRHAVFWDHLEVVKLLHRRGAAFAPQDKWGSTPVHNALLFNSHHVLSYLLGMKLRVDQKYYNGKTVLHLLAENADLDTIERFSSANFEGVDAAGVDSKGCTALDYLRRRKDVEGLMEPFQCLLVWLDSRTQCGGQAVGNRTSKDFIG